MVQLAGSLTQFVTSDEMGGLDSEMQYSRRGGFFISKSKAALIIIVAIGVVALVGSSIYFLAPCRNSMNEQAPDEESMISESLKYTRLPNEVRPSYYRLKIFPILEEPWTFNGTVLISISTTTPVNKIILNAKGLLISETNVRLTTMKIAPSLEAMSQTLEESTTVDSTTTAAADTTDESTTEESSTAAIGQEEELDPTPPTVERVVEVALPISRQEQVVEDEQYIFHLYENLEPNQNYTLEIPFERAFEDSDIGFYKSFYTMDDKLDWFAATQFYPAYARLAFPCFDEPTFKAEFEISIARKMHMNTVTNMPLRESEPFGIGWTWDHFHKSAFMSTYLVSFMVSDMPSTNAISSDTAIDIWSRPILKSFTSYASVLVPKILTKYNKYFGNDYSLPKLSLVGNPTNNHGAFEYWGMIVFKESTLLLDRENSEPEDNLMAVKTMSHALAHMWFGNLVTMEWWTDFWLTEGFATFMQFIGADHVEPQWHFLDQYVLAINNLMTQDSLRTSKPIKHEVDMSHPLSLMFNTVPKVKASALIRMLNFTLTEPVFLTAVQSFLTTWKFKTATSDDFWNIFTEAIVTNSSASLDGLSVKEIMDTWTQQRGYPVVNVTIDYSTGGAVLTQENFAFDLAAKDASLLWDIPISFTSSNAESKWTATPKTWMKRSKVVTLEEVVTPGHDDSWVIFNDLKTGFYRVNYDTSTWQRIINVLNTSHTILPVVTRSQIINDAFSLAEAGYLSYEIAFSVTLYLKNERNHIPWATAMKCLRDVETNFRTNIEYEILQEYITTIMSDTYDVVMAEAPSIDNMDYSLLRSDLTSWLCNLDHEVCVQKAFELFNKWKETSNPEKNNPITGPFKTAYYCTAVRRGGKNEWNFIMKRVLETPILAEKETLIEGLMCTTQSWNIIKVLEKTLSGEIGILDAKMVWTNLKSQIAVNIGFDFVRANWKRIWDRFSKIEGLLSKVVSFLSNLSTEMKYEELVDFISKRPNSMKPIRDTMTNILDMIKLRLEWKKKYIPVIANWINATRT